MSLLVYSAIMFIFDTTRPKHMTLPMLNHVIIELRYTV